MIICYRLADMLIDFTNYSINLCLKKKNLEFPKKIYLNEIHIFIASKNNFRKPK